jgi:hypothetical protein
MLLASTMGERTGLRIPVKLLVERERERGKGGGGGEREGEGERGRGWRGKGEQPCRHRARQLAAGIPNRCLSSQ